MRFDKADISREYYFLFRLALIICVQLGIAGGKAVAQSLPPQLNSKLDPEANRIRAILEQPGEKRVGPDGTLLRANQAELDMLGYARGEYVGRNIADFHVDQSVISDILRRLKAGETLRDTPAQLRAKDGRSAMS
jgi:PAS domain-containing protein